MNFKVKCFIIELEKRGNLSLKNSNLLSFFKETTFNTYPYNMPSFPIVSLSDSPIRNLHYHKRFEIGYCYKGSGECETLDKIESFKTGDAEFFFPYQPHISRSKKNDISQWHFSYFDISVVFSDPGFNKDYWETLVESERGLHGIIKRENYPEICDCIEKIISISRGNDINKHIKCRLLIGQLLIYITDNNNKDNNKNNTKSRRLQKLLPALTYIKKNYAEKITITELAKLCLMSVSSFRANFSIETGMSPQEYIIYTRMQYAKNYLENTTMTIQEIQKKCGFSDSANFYKQFLKRYGVSPSEYRKRT